MIFGRHGTFTGGIDLPDLKQAVVARRIVAADRPPRLRVPLAPCGGAPARMVLSAPAHVSAGQKIAQAADESGVDVHAPLTGRIGEPTEAEVICARGAFISPAIEITELGPVEPIVPTAPVFDWRTAGAELLREKIAAGPLTTARPRMRRLARWVEDARRCDCRFLIANVVEPQPHAAADHRLLAEHGTEVIRGLAMLSMATGARETILAVDSRRTGSYRRLEVAARACGVSTVALPPKYPVGNDTIIVKVLTRREVPIGGESFDVGVAVTDAATCFAAYRWVACEAPPLGRVVTVSGGAAAQPGNYYVPFGTECGELAGQADGLLVHGGVMSGHMCSPATVVTAATDAVLAIAREPAVAAAPCIRCGWCTDHCPARLNVAALNDIYELGRVERSERAGVLACVECGVCTYVCPARILLSQRVKQLKRVVFGLRERIPLFTTER
ncbi:MAG TPA: 4Fe-4S dicluster domain-containing protein [Phycisphaerae bacterium]|nr:4Fe-4S dicluster domain-containing protein [Phycisphaerae bacterium]